MEVAVCLGDDSVHSLLGGVLPSCWTSKSRFGSAPKNHVELAPRKFALPVFSFLVCAQTFEKPTA